jgi:NAD(P)-dependent dehydrogenase (short-subunit alcohol dehydrogenase family)
VVGKVVLVTGANVGIGKETALALARMGATVVMLCRSKSKGEAAQAEIKAASNNSQIDLILADFASLAAVRRAAETFQERYDRLDVLVNNAGLYLGERLLSADGYEMTFAVNHLAPFLLTNLLIDTLKASAPARIVNVSSGAHAGGRMRFDDLQSARSYQGFRAYADSKLANILFTTELARRLAGTGVTANSLHPGAVASNFAQGTKGFFGFIFGMARSFMLTPEQGAQTSIYLASAPEVADVSGAYFVKSKPSRTASQANDADAARRLWEVSEQLVGLGMSMKA